MNINSPKKVKILILASGNGSNAENIIDYFNNNNYKINWVIIPNNPRAGVIEKSKKLSTPCVILSKNQFQNGDALTAIKKIRPSLIILAGFLLKISENILENFPNKIIENFEKQSGITIHFVNKNYDEGKIIFQRKLKINYPCTSHFLAKKIHELEMKFFPLVIEDLIKTIHYE